MKIRDLLGLNNSITDVEITVLKSATETVKVDALHIGPDFGVKPPYPDMVPKSREFAGNICEATKKEATYIRKSINAYDDGKDYFEIKFNRFPSGWLDLEVWSWRAGHVYAKHHDRHTGLNDYQGIRIYALESGAVLETKTKGDKKVEEQLEGQTSIYDFLG